MMKNEAPSNRLLLPALFVASNMIQKLQYICFIAEIVLNEFLLVPSSQVSHSMHLINIPNKNRHIIQNTEVPTGQESQKGAGGGILTQIYM